MATRYLKIGLTANSNDVNSWSATSGGATGASVPTLSDDVICDASSLTGASGNLTLNADFSCASFTASGLIKSLTLTANGYSFTCYGNFTRGSNITFNFINSSALIITQISGTSNITLTGNSTIFPIIKFKGGHTGYFDITGSNIFSEVLIDGGRKVRVTAGTTQTITKSLKGGSGNTLATLTSTTPGSTYTINAPNGLTSSFLDISYANVIGGMTANYSRNRIGNTGILFNSQAGIHKPKRGFINNKVNDLSSLKGTGPTQGLIAAYQFKKY